MGLDMGKCGWKPRAVPPVARYTCFPFTVMYPSPAGQPNRVLEHPGTLQLRPSALRPDCPSERRIHLWHSPNPSARLPHASPFMNRARAIASEASLTGPECRAVGAALHKFHVFCAIFGTPERERLPASAALLRDFVTWATTEPNPWDPSLASGIPFEPIGADTARSYLAGIDDWHIAQGFPPPLTNSDWYAIRRDLRRLANVQNGLHKQPRRPPVTLAMFRAVRAHMSAGRGLHDPNNAPPSGPSPAARSSASCV
jgi:hypothetical protein